MREKVCHRVKMSEVQTLRELENQRRTAAFEETRGVFERTIAEHEEEVCPSQEKVRLRLHTADVQQLLLQQERRSSLDQEEPEPSHIKKEEEEELLISQEGEQLHHLEEADVTKFTFTLVPVKSEEDEEKVQSSQQERREAESVSSSSTEQMKRESDGEDCGGPGPARNTYPGMQQLLVQQEWSLSVKEEEPEPSLIKKEEEEELLISQEGEQHHGLGEADVTKVPFTLVPVKSEEDEDKVQSSELQNQTEERR
ncbi:hypothetical protein LDENG_00237570, partial [Lucifuga dentata]